MWVVLISSCTTNTTKLFCRTWKVDKATLDEKGSFLGPQQRADIAKQIADGTTFTFKADGSYIATRPDGDTPGNWNFMADKKSFHGETADIKADFNIDKLDKKSLVFSGKVIMGQTVHFECSPVTKTK